MDREFFIKRRKGAALIWMLLALTLLMIIMTSMVYIVRQDIFETAKQEERLQTYYIALAGIELTHAALMDTSQKPINLKVAAIKLDGNGNTPLTDTIEVKTDGNDGNIIGSADVSIKRVVIDSKKWIQITSVGQLSGKNTEVTSTMRINEANTNQIVRQKFGN